MKPEFPDEDPINPFDFWTGANFKIKIRQVEGYRNYDKSEFETAAPVSNDDDELQVIWNKEYPLKDFLSESNFKSYDELKRKLDQVLSDTGANAKAEATELEETAAQAVAKETKPKAAKETKPKVEEETVDEDEEDTLSYFTKLANSD